jgi:hypothetical protein
MHTYFFIEELNGRAGSALRVRSRKLSIVRRGQSLDGWSKFIISSSSVLRKARKAVGPGCICSLYHPLQFQGGLTSSRQAGLSQHDEKHVVPTPLSGIRVRRRYLSCFIPKGVAEASMIFLRDTQNYFAVINTAVLLLLFITTFIHITHA